MEVASLTQRCLHTMQQQARCQSTAHLRSSLATSSRRPYSHFPARRKSCGAGLSSSSRLFSTSRHVLQVPPSQPQSSLAASRYSPSATSPSTIPSTAPKPSIINDMVKDLRTSAYVPSKQPLSEQLAVFDDVLDYMGTDPKRRPPRSPLSADDGGIDQQGLYENLIGAGFSQSDERKVSLRLKPELGRTQPLDLTRNVDLTAAFRRVERKCAENNVRIDAKNQRIHVRRGQQRKDDRRRRWRIVFKEGFLHECARIRRMKAQGW